MDSTPDAPHGPSDLVDRIIEGFDTAPYEMAIGGGEPTCHPDFPSILERCRQKGTVPSYTTSGLPLDDDVVAATNRYVGSVAMSYHPHQGLEWFERRIEDLRSKLEVPLHVHLVATDDVAQHLHDLIELRSRKALFDEIVLLAYYPMGRGGYDDVMSPSTYGEALPEAIKKAQTDDISVSFSEGLLPYFLSRQDELDKDLSYSMRSEGAFSCFVDMKGRMYPSSFSERYHQDTSYVTGSVLEDPSQKLWDHLGVPYRSEGNNCMHCHYRNVCSQPDFTHYLQCHYSEINGGIEAMESDHKRPEEAP
jgi:MoaA/NifB/PqqE/SkfB family radical SAM enzyme